MEGLENTRELRQEKKETNTAKKYENKIKKMQKEVCKMLLQIKTCLLQLRSGVKITGDFHEHEYDTEQYNSKRDIYWQTCKTCGFLNEYEKF
jgi:hypothetical protein